MALFTDDIIRDLLAKSLKTATIDENGWRNTEENGGSTEARHIAFLTFKNLEASVVEDVERIRKHPLVAKNIPIYGYVYDVRSGKLIEVPEATHAGEVLN
jgi:carbonic anhydrase